MIAVALSVTALVLGAAGDDTAITLDQRKQLFLDDYLIAAMTNVNRRVLPAEKHKGNPVIWQTEPWEDKFNVLYGSVSLRTDSRHLWHLAATAGGRGDTVRQYVQLAEGRPIRANRPVSLDYANLEGCAARCLAGWDSCAGAVRTKCGCPSG